MIWLTWRQQRTETLLALLLLALLAALLIPTGLNMASVYRHDGLAACLGKSTSPSCDQLIGSFTERFNGTANLLAWFTLVSGLIGVLFAAPFVIEVESGTFRFAWTQSITRRRWIATKLGLTTAGALLVVLALTALMTWWHTPLDHVNGRMNNSVYDAEGIVAFGYVLLALGLTLAVGVVWRRAVPAIAVALAGYIAARTFVETWLRQRFEAPLTATWPAAKPGPNLRTAWVLTEQPSDKHGHLIAPTLHGIQSCSPAIPAAKRALNPSCLGHGTIGYMHAVYQPASRFWLFQGIETALFAGTGLALILFAAWWTHQHTA